MKRTFKLYIIIGFIFVSVVGTLSHFVYEWSGNNRYVSYFVPVNESTWEHMKLLFFPTVLYMLILVLIHRIRCARDSKLYLEFNKTYPCFFYSINLGLIKGLVFIPVSFYAYSGILGFNVTWIDMAIFFISVLIVFFTVYKNAYKKSRKFSLIYLFSLILPAVCFFYFTWNAPKLALFISP